MCSIEADQAWFWIWTGWVFLHHFAGFCNLAALATNAITNGVLCLKSMLINSTCWHGSTDNSHSEAITENYLISSNCKTESYQNVVQAHFYTLLNSSKLKWGTTSLWNPSEAQWSLAYFVQKQSMKYGAAHLVRLWKDIAIIQIYKIFSK